jgi:SAM-dependent methyltransferase
MTDRPQYSLALSEQEVDRYRYMAQVARETEAAQWELAGIKPGARIVDIGCGPGLTTIELADIAGPSGRVAAIDRETAPVETARALLRQRGFDGVEVRQGPAWDSGFENESFDVVNIRHVLAHNVDEDVARILRHAYALLVPGGRAYVVDADITGSRTDPPNADVYELNARYAQHLRDSGRNPSMGPELGSAVLAAGLELVARGGAMAVPPPENMATIRPPSWAAREAMLASGHATPDDIERWGKALDVFAAAAVENRAAFFVPMYWVIAEKPS